jgi:4-hydroxybenzoate polyprenyltransferase
VGVVLATRPGQWVKNLACFAGLIFSGQLFDERAALRALLAFAGFCLAASAVYLLNDVCDRPLDRLNPSKRMRPIAAGLVPVSWALSASLTCTILALALGWWLSPVCAALTAVYIASNLAYSLRLKHAVLLDVAVIALGFVLRVLDGVYAVEVKPTAWIVLCMFFLALFLGFAKRRGEIHRMGEDEVLRRPVLAKYRSTFLDTLLAMTATMSILCYSLYTVTGHQGNATLVVTVPLVTYGVTRYMLLVIVRGEGEAPEKLLSSDRVLLATAALWVILCVLIIYSKIQIFTE